METSPTHDITKVILSTLRAPGVSRHAVVLRHAVDNLESGQTKRALKTLDQAGKTLNLDVFLELSRFLEKHAVHLSTAINSPAWADMMATLNHRRYRWQAMMESQGLSQLLSMAMSMRTSADSGVARPSMERMGEDTPAVHEMRPVVQGKSEGSARAVGQPKPIATKVAKDDDAVRVNYTAAAATFLVTMLVVLLWWLRS